MATAPGAVRHVDREYLTRKEENEPSVEGTIVAAVLRDSNDIQVKPLDVQASLKANFENIEKIQDVVMEEYLGSSSTLKRKREEFEVDVVIGNLDDDVAKQEVALAVHLELMTQEQAIRFPTLRSFLLLAPQHNEERNFQPSTCALPYFFNTVDGDDDNYVLRQIHMFRSVTQELSFGMAICKFMYTNESMFIIGDDAKITRFNLQTKKKIAEFSETDLVKEYMNGSLVDTLQFFTQGSLLFTIYQTEGIDYLEIIDYETSESFSMAEDGIRCVFVEGSKLYMQVNNMIKCFTIENGEKLDLIEDEEFNFQSKTVECLPFFHAIFKDDQVYLPVMTPQKDKGGILIYDKQGSFKRSVTINETFMFSCTVPIDMCIEHDKLMYLYQDKDKESRGILVIDLNNGLIIGDLVDVFEDERFTYEALTDLINIFDPADKMIND